MSSKMWKRIDKPSCLFQTTHKDRTGGGELYAHQIAAAFNEITDLRYFSGGGGGLHEEFSDYHKLPVRFLHTGLQYVPDILLGCSHFQPPAATGRHRNVFITFFPNKDHVEQVKKYDTIITCSSFSAEWVRKYWRKKAVVIHPWVNVNDYKIGPKKSGSIINVGRFFREEHGHSKKQHVLIEALADIRKKSAGDFNLALAGSVLNDSDHNYLEFCQNLASDLGVGKSVTFHPNAMSEELAELYSRAEFYWHANGYESTTPYETEHFGIVIAEAMASGCVPVIFAGGGHKDFNCASWKTPHELAAKTLNLKRQLDADGTETPSARGHAEMFRAFVKDNFKKKAMHKTVEMLIKR